MQLLAGLCRVDLKHASILFIRLGMAWKISCLEIKLFMTYGNLAGSILGARYRETVGAGPGDTISEANIEWLSRSSGRRAACYLNRRPR